MTLCNDTAVEEHHHAQPAGIIFYFNFSNIATASSQAYSVVYR
jgi:hypothetical protein